MIDILIVVILSALIGFRLARAVTIDDVGATARDKVRDFQASKPEAPWRGKLVVFFRCVHCVGFWITLVVGLILSAIFLDVDWPADIAIATAATGLQSLFGTYALRQD